MHHEEVEGQFDWSDNKDLRAFIKLCQQHDMWVYPRIGPWCHAEVRNGGTPDWLLLKNYMQDRSNDPVYQHYAADWYAHVADQLKGLLYKDSGPVIGIQLENEYGRGKGGEAHISWLKQAAQKCGLDVPMYTVTGWQNGSVPPYEVIPLWGAYPDEPWADNLNRNTDCGNFRFTPFRDNDHIGNDVKQGKDSYVDNAAYPFFTCEVGVGIENTEHRRLKIGALDGLALITAKIGSGSNLPGYYMFAGGTNPHGLLTSMEENKQETGYWNTNPVVSYDFQAAIRESGQLNDCYHEVKSLHYFLNEFGDRLAPMQAAFPAAGQDLQYTVRVNNNAGFLFGLNYCRHNIQEDKKETQFNIKLAGETISFPEKKINIPDSSIFIWPFNFQIETALLKYATAQPLCHIDNKWVFIQDAGIVPEFCFDAVTAVTSTSGKVVKKNDRYIVSGLQPGLQCVITVQPKSGVAEKIFILSAVQAKQVWLFDKRLFVSAANLYVKDSMLHAYSTDNHFKIAMLSDSSFTECSYEVAAQKIDISWKQELPLQQSKWLQTSDTSTKNNLFHRFFIKEFSTGNPSGIKSASLLIYAQGACNVQVNNRWVNQSLIPGQLNTLDLTGYIQKGENTIMLDFPFEAGKKSFAAKINVEYLNADKVSFVTDQSWLTKDAYTYPTFLKRTEGLKAPMLSTITEDVKSADLAYTVQIPADYPGTLNNVYLNIRYTGDKGRLYYNQQLIGDDFNNGDGWTIGLNRFGTQLEGQSLRLELSPLLSPAHVYFDDATAKQAAVHAALQSVKLIPEYKIDIPLK
jgi:hypothetical protein